MDAITITTIATMDVDVILLFGFLSFCPVAEITMMTVDAGSVDYSTMVTIIAAGP